MTDTDHNADDREAVTLVVTVSVRAGHAQRTGQSLAEHLTADRLSRMLDHELEPMFPHGVAHTVTDGRTVRGMLAPLLERVEAGLDPGRPYQRTAMVTSVQRLARLFGINL